MTTVWVNVFIAPLDKKRFYFSLSYPSEKKAIKALGKGRKGNKNQTYICTLSVNINLNQNNESY